MNTFIMDKMQRDQAQYAGATDSGAQMRRRVGMDWSDPDDADAWPGTLVRCGAEHSRALLRRCRIRAVGSDDPDMRAHELDSADQEALDSFMAGGL